jgi:hypothetical protein
VKDHEQLHRTLRLAAQLLDNAASQVRDLPLEPTKEHIRVIGEALVLLSEVRSALEAVRPQLASQFEQSSQEESQANRRLGEAILAAEDLSEEGKNEEAHSLLQRFAAQEPSELHRGIALRQASCYKQSDGT